ncbi:MAG: hypothetical protein JXA21_13465 [Anaerolineae bacterium]|nr:hypothetical protein [Anaerolineae bacterium]
MLNWAEWLAKEPFISVMGLMALIGFLSADLQRSRTLVFPFRLWLLSLLRGGAAAVLLLGMFVAFYAILTQNVQNFYDLHNRDAVARWEKVTKNWGTILTQEELIVRPFVVHVEQDPFPRQDPDQPVHYQTVTRYERLSQNNITGFDGVIVMRLVDSSEYAQGESDYNTYLLRARYTYTVTNPSDLETANEFYFLPPSGNIFLDEFSVSVDGNDITSELMPVSPAFYWERTLAPGQQQCIVITYWGRGLDGFYYQVSHRRELKDFSLALSLNTPSFYVMRDPEVDALVPTQTFSDSTHLLWRLDQTVMAPRFGVALVQPERPYSPYSRVYNLLRYTPRSALLLGVMVLLTCLICGESLQLGFMGVLLSGYSLQCFVVSGFGSYADGRLWIWAVGAILSAIMLFILFFMFTSGLLRVLLCVQGTVCLLYPLASLLRDLPQRDAVDIGLQAGLILYLFGLILYTRVRAQRQEHGG